MIGVVADDLTGAAELGGVGWRCGLRAEVVVASAVGTETDLVCVDTDSRSLTPSEAASRVATAVRTLIAAGATTIYKKVDSVLRGNVRAEIESLLRELRLPRALLLPANPGLGRVIREGNYFVGGKPLHETDFRFDPEHPRQSSDVRALLGAAGLLPVQVCRVAEPLPAAGIAVGECSSADDLRQWAEAGQANTLAVGGAEFFAAWLAARGATAGAGRGLDSIFAEGRPGLFVCGSASNSTSTFLAEARRDGVPVFGLPPELSGGAEFTTAARDRLVEAVRQALASHPRAVLAVGLPQVSDPQVARRLGPHLTDVARMVLSASRVGQVFVEGGATAASLVRRMGWRRLEIVREISPGVVTLRVVDDGNKWLTLKPGSYAWPAGVCRPDGGMVAGT